MSPRRRGRVASGPLEPRYRIPPTFPPPRRHPVDNRRTCGQLAHNPTELSAPTGTIPPMTTTTSPPTAANLGEYCVDRWWLWAMEKPPAIP